MRLHFYRNNDPSVGSSFYLFPNPANDYSEVKLPDAVNKDFSLRVFDVLGNEINVPLQASQQSFRLDLSSLHSAMYFVQINADNKVFTQKLLKH